MVSSPVPYFLSQMHVYQTGIERKQISTYASRLRLMLPTVVPTSLVKLVLHSPVLLEH